MEGVMEETKIGLQMIKMSEIQSQEVSWLWYPFIPYGKLTIIQGDPGDGKTTLVLNIAAKLSRGEGLDTRNSIFKNIGNKIRIEQAVKHDLRHGTL